MIVSAEKPLLLLLFLSKPFANNLTFGIPLVFNALVIVEII